VFSADNGSWQEDHYPESVGVVAAESLVKASVRHLAQEFAERFASGVPESQLLALGGQLAGLMLEARGNGVDQPGDNGLEIYGRFIGNSSPSVLMNPIVDKMERGQPLEP
jgi:hypothetical protein